MATLDALSNKLATLSAPDSASRSVEILGYLRSRSEFEASGMNEDGSFWARFSDGRLLLLPITRDQEVSFDSPPGLVTPTTQLPGLTGTTAIMGPGEFPAAAGPPAELPTSVQARFLSGGEPPGSPSLQPFLEGLVASRGYRPAAAAGSGTVDDLMRVGGDGIFWFGGHGGWGYDKNDSRVYGVTTATTISPENDRTYTALLADLSLAYSEPLNDRLQPFFNPRPNGQLPNDYYAFTAKFVELHMGDFADGSLVYMAACSSWDPDFRNAFLGKGAGVYFGWTDTFWPVADGLAAAFLFDRLLGTNTSTISIGGTNIRKENPDQRPFDYASVYQDMVSRNLVTSARATLLYQPGAPESGPLAPTIQYMDVDETRGGSKDYGLLILTGKFGTDPGEVKIGNQELDVQSWGKERITARIPVSGPQSAGDVVVWSKGRKSNPRRLTDWRPTFHWEFKPPNAGSLKMEGELHLHFRADAASYREEAGKAPKYRTVQFSLAGDSFGELEASGTENKTKWEGVADISNRIARGSQNLMDGIGEIETEVPFMRLALFVVVLNGMESVDLERGVRITLPMVWAKGESELTVGTPGLPALDIGLNQQFGMRGATKREVDPPDPSAILFWSDYSPQYPPDNTLARSPIALRAGIRLETLPRPKR